MATLPNISCNYYKIGMKKKNKFFLCYILIMLLLTVGNSSNTPDERLALNDLRTALNDTQNLLKDWDIYLSTPCDTWSRISCRNGHVVSLGLSSCGFTGTLSPSITNLKYLEKLELQDNNLKGELPDYLGKMLNLNSLDLGRNSFTGSIPKTWDQLGTHLTYLDLSFNSLNGRVPKQLFDVSIFNFTGNHLMCDNSGNQQPCVSTSISMGSAKKSKMQVAMISASIIAFFLLLLGSIYTYTRKRSHKSISDKFFDVAGEDDRKFTFGQVNRFSWCEIQLATNNFSEANIIGQGGFGKVYKGILMDGTKVAVKRLMDYNNPGGEAAFLREIQLISVAVHKNLLRLIGFCTTSWERILVYPFMQNLSVAYRLRELKPGEKGLDWAIRKRIALGTAHGLEYLHEKCNPKIIHRDLKAANILLDENFDAVLGDFGLAKVVDSKLTHVTTQVRGTMGHIAPEYLTTGKSSEKTDVFGYGVSLLELVTGQRAIDFARLEEEEDVLLLDHIKKLLRESRIHDIVDSKMKEFDPKEAEMMLKVALLCAQSEPERRPKMDEVVKMLRGGGLEERWAQWETVEEDRMNQELTQMAHLFPWADESTDDQESLQLSSAR